MITETRNTESMSDDHKIPVCGADHLHSGSKDGWYCVRARLEASNSLPLSLASTCGSSKSQVTTKLIPSSGPALTSRSAAVPIPTKTPTMGSVRSFWAGRNMKPLGFGLFRTFLVSNMVACGNYYVASFSTETFFIRPNSFQPKPRMKVVEDERYIFTSSMLGLLAEYGIRPHVINALVEMCK
ncbi:hypothetical protein NE237_008673 [Protea cynaroides]|uniref:Uncharacterized protein n=1 Tax=Protea cynaroides TaxID=273540 RepID=A0A9Q0QZK5_9MAGN|nr:hypothetical protein NE237_008673 [Protea cynaroides]